MQRAAACSSPSLGDFSFEHSRRRTAGRLTSVVDEDAGLDGGLGGFQVVFLRCDHVVNGIKARFFLGLSFGQRCLMSRSASRGFLFVIIRWHLVTGLRSLASTTSHQTIEGAKIEPARDYASGIFELVMHKFILRA
jgi:hypothetical protein